MGRRLPGDGAVRADLPAGRVCRAAAASWSRAQAVGFGGARLPVELKSTTISVGRGPEDLGRVAVAGFRFGGFG